MKRIFTYNALKVIAGIVSVFSRKKKMVIGCLALGFLLPSCRNNTVHCYTGPVPQKDSLKKDSSAVVPKDTSKHEVPVKTCYAPPRLPKN